MKINKLLILGAFSTFWVIGCSSLPVEDEQTSAEATVATNTANVATNTANVATNTANVATNTANVATNAAEVTKQVYEAKLTMDKEYLAKEEARKKKKYHRSKLIKISGIGYGAASSFANITKGQRRLMAIRASKLDAYRSLAEQLYGIKIDSNTAVSTLTVKGDSFRARVNALVRGARIVSITPMADSNYETVLEVFVDRSFFSNTFVYSQKRIEEEEANDCDNSDCAVNVGSQY